MSIEVTEELILTETKPISDARVKELTNFLYEFWEQYNKNVRELVLDVREKFDSLHSGYGEIVPVVPFDLASQRDAVNAVLFASGKATTLDYELEAALRIKEDLGFNPVKYVAVVSNANDKSDGSVRVREVAEKYRESLGVKYVCLDFKEWYKKMGFPKTKGPIPDTNFITENEIPDSERARRFDIRQQFESALMGELERIVRINPHQPALRLRGYNFPFIGYEATDTHPADLRDYNPETGKPRYPGWQSKATEGMIKDGYTTFHGSLIYVNPITDPSLWQDLDAGELLYAGGGYELPEKRTAKQIQTAMKLTEDRIMCYFEAMGGTLLMGRTVRPGNVHYFTSPNGRDGVLFEVQQRLVVVGDRIMSGCDAFELGNYYQLKEMFHDCN